MKYIASLLITYSNENAITTRIRIIKLIPLSTNPNNTALLIEAEMYPVPRSQPTETAGHNSPAHLGSGRRCYLI